jgi:hypothetical protein
MFCVVFFGLCLYLSACRFTASSFSSSFFFKLPTVIVLVVLGSLIEFVDPYSLFAFSLSLVLLFFPTFDRAYDFTHVGNVLDLSSFSDVFINQLLRGERSRRENRYVDNP